MLILIVLVLLIALFVLALAGRSGHKNMDELSRWSYAHRGLHGDGIPENSLAAFKLAAWKGYGSELDVHLMQDGGLAVIHDSLLKRTTGREGRIEDLTVKALPYCHLEGTFQTIPTLQEVLEVYNGKAPLIIELKTEDLNHAALCQAVCDALEGYEGLYCIESFDPRAIQWLKENKPHIIRGQLAANFLKDKSTNLSLPIRIVLTNLLMNFLTAPDFIAYKFEDRKSPARWLSENVWNVQQVSWTLRSPKQYNAAVQEGAIPIFEGFEP
jgi:glycerophosphoryl diester phosphodiesterase